MKNLIACCGIDCALLDTCEIVGALLKYVPEGRANLLALNDMSA